MKKPMALLLSAALLALPVSPAVAFADTTPETSTVSTTSIIETQVEEQEAPENEAVSEESTIVDTDGKEVKPGTLPDSPLYWLDELVEKLQVALTFNPEKKVKLIERHACERLAEILAMAEKVAKEQTAPEATEPKEPESTESTETTDTDATEDTESTDTTGATEGTEPSESTDVTEDNESPTENTNGASDVVSEGGEATAEDSEEGTIEEAEPVVTNPKMEKKYKACEKALKGYNAKIAHAQEFLSKLEDTNSEEYQKVQEALAKVNAKNVLVLGSLLEKLPPQASQRLAVNIVRSMEKAVEKIEKMEEKNKGLVDESNQEESTEESIEGSVDGDGSANPKDDSATTPGTTDKNITTPVTVTTTPEAPVTNAKDKKNDKYSDKLSKKEYKELSKEAKSALKHFQRDLGLKGPYNIKNPEKPIPQKKEVPSSHKNDKSKQNHGRDDDRGNGKSKH